VLIRINQNMYAMTGTELKIVTPAAETEILGPEVDRLPTLHTNARGRIGSCSRSG
jgi:hypothetical protein